MGITESSEETKAYESKVEESIEAILPPLGVTFYAVTKENSKHISEIRQRLFDAGIPYMWTNADYHGKKVLALNVYANANVVAQYLK